MQASVRPVIADPGYSFTCQFCDFEKFPFFWHFHPECEIVLVLAGRGARFVGDNIDNFDDGDLVLLGPNLPHAWHSEPHGPHGQYRRRSIVIQFREDFLGPGFFDRPELAEIRRLLRRAERGLRFTGATQAQAACLMMAMKDAQGFDRLVKLLSLLSLLTEGGDAVTLSSASFAPPARGEGQQRMALVSQYINDRLTEPLSLEEVAAVAHMSSSAFSRFFRRASGKCFTDYVNELRVGSACRMLIETDRTVAEIAFAAGFNNLSHFNRQFLRLKRMSPRDFRNHFVRSAATATR
jgi:AraC-like DNA-binding protein